LARKEIKGPINDNTLNNTNHNFKELYDEFGNVVKTVSDKAFDKVVDSAKLNWKEPVSSQSNLPDDADEGDTRMARDTGKVYRFDWYSWKEIQEIDAGPVNEVDTRLTSQLAQTTLFGIKSQTDFVDIINRANAITNSLFVRKRSDRAFEVCIPFKGNKAQQWYMEKDENDDFIKLSAGYISEYGISNVSIGTKLYDSTSGNWIKSGNYHYTTEVGATFTTEFEGNGVEFIYFEDARGGMWEFVVDGDESNKINVSVYGTSSATKRVLIVDGLSDGTHTIIGTFKGDDPNNTPSSGSGTSRGWVYAGGGGTWTMLETAYEFVKEVEVFKAVSNKEFALSIRPPGTSEPQWVPEHNGIGTVFTVEQKVYFDNELQTNWEFQDNYSQFNSITVVQKMVGKHSEKSNESLEITTIHTFNANGVFTKTKIKVLEDIPLTGYAMMAPVNINFTNKMVTNLDNSYEIAEGIGNHDLIENDKASSFLFTGNSEYPNYAAAMSISQPIKTLRMGEEGRRNPVMWLQNRSSSLAKLYPNVFESYVAKEGEEFEFSGYYVFGELPLANELYG